MLKNISYLKKNNNKKGYHLRKDASDLTLDATILDVIQRACILIKLTNGSYIIDRIKLWNMCRTNF